MKVSRFGESAWVVDVDRRSPEADAALARDWARALQAAFPEAEVIAGGSAVIVDRASSANASAIESALEKADPFATTSTQRHEIRVVYDGEDLDAVAHSTGLSRAEVIAVHTRGSYTVEVTGFLPGFGYLATLDARLRLPRLASPRKVVPAGSVGIAGRFTGIYPFASPGGWHLLGRAVDPELFDPSRHPPARLAKGDEVAFVAVEREHVLASPAKSIEPTLRRLDLAHLEIVVCPAHATIQDLGRRLGSFGIPRSGPLDVETHRAANRAVGNAESEATLELPIDRFEARVLRDVWLSVDGGAPTQHRAGDIVKVDRHERAVRYLAVRGGIDVPVVLGSRSTLLVAGLGGLEGRRLRRGDRLWAADSPKLPAADAETVLQSSGSPFLVSVVRGPHIERFSPDALSLLCAEDRTVSTMSDRVGTRFEGTPIGREGVDDGAPEPMRPGAMQIATNGTPIVLGPDSAVTGGYPVLAVLTESATARLARVRPGGRVRFALVE